MELRVRNLRVRSVPQAIVLVVPLLLGGADHHFDAVGDPVYGTHDATPLLGTSDELAAMVAEPTLRTIQPGQQRTWGAPPRGPVERIRLSALALASDLGMGGAFHGVLSPGRPDAPRAPPTLLTP